MEKKLMRIESIKTVMMGDEVGMLNVNTNRYYALGLTGTRIWEILESPKTFDELVDVLMQEYDVSKEQCEVDVREFVIKLKEELIIKEV